MKFHTLNPSKLTALVASATLCIVCSQHAKAAVIYSQTFTGSATTLNGTTPTVGSGTWVGNDIVNLNGATTATAGSVALAFTPSSGFVYDLTATIDTTAGGSWFGVAFLETNGTYGFFGAQTTPAALAVASENWQNWPPGVNHATTSNDILIRLDTTGAQWTSTWFQGGVQMGSTVTYTTNPTINFVGFVTEGSATSTVSAFELSAVPEPSAGLLMAVGVASTFLFARRRRLAQV